jgi:hypothetical protein
MAIGMSNEAMRFYQLDQMAKNGDMSRQMTFPWPAAHKSIACEHLTIR